MKRNPNGYGTIAKLSGDRAKPYAVMSPLRNVNGKPKRDYIGFFQTEEEARNYLAEYNQTRGSNLNFTLEELWNDWQKYGFRKLSKQTKDNYRAAWKHLSQIGDVKVRDCRTRHFQFVVDGIAEDGMSESSIKKVIVLAGLLEKYAMQSDIIGKNYAEFIQVPECKKVEEKEPFTDEQIYILEQNAESNWIARYIVCLIYSGWRIAEFLQLKVKDVDLNEMTFKGGLKTNNGRNRIVPIHSAIQKYVADAICGAEQDDFVFSRLNEGGKRVQITPNYFRRYLFNDTLSVLNIRRQNGTDFTPHSTRHTFATLCSRYNLDEICYKRMLGHSQDGITEKVYIHKTVDDLRTEIEKIKTQTEIRTSTETNRTA